MFGPPPAPKRKRSFLHPGSWGGKRSRTNSRSGSPPDLDTSTPGAVNPHNAAQIATHFRSSSPNGGPATLGPYPSTSGVQDDTTLGRQGIAPASPVATPGRTPNQDTNKTAWEALGKALGALHITAKICPPLHSAIDGLKSCLHIFEEAARTRKDYAELATGLTAMVDLLVEHISVAVSKEITGALASVAKNITKEVELIKKRQSLNGPRRMLVVSGDDEDLVRRYRRIEQLFRQLQAEASMSTWNDTKKHLINTQLENLGPVKLAVFNSAMSTDIGRRSCTENTRTQILVDSMAWADNPDGAKIYWMNGMAGTGKTTIAYSLCERLEAAGQLAASFFCTRTSRECSEAKRIIPTVAYQLARRSAPFRDALCGVLDKDPDIGTLNTTSQFDSLLAKPLVESKELMTRNQVVVIDALDECDNPHAVKIVLDILFRYAADLPVKFFVTSRPEPTIRSSMMSGIAECNRPHSILYLHEIEKSLVQADIELYLKDELKDMLPAHCADIEELAEQAGNLFIYAATAVRYIRPTGKAVNSRQRLKTILEVNNQSNKSMSAIDTLYSTILSAAIHDTSLEPNEQKSIQAVLWTAICACEPVLIDTLAALCDLDQTDAAVSALEPLRSVLHVSDHNHLVTTLHASFPDFMFTEERSQEFFCDRSIHDQFLARRCLDIMKAQLRFNICKLESSFILDDEIPDLKARVESRISLELFYTSRFWVDHLSQGGAPSSLFELLYEFLSQRLLFWMEVLNLKKCIVVGAVASTKAHMWLRASDASPELIALARDAQIFVGKYAANQVSESTPHIYLSALPLSSPASLIRSHYLPKFTGLVQAAGTFMERTDQAPLETWLIGSPIRSVSFSVDRKHIIIGTDNGRIFVKNPHTGETILDFKAHRKVISSVAFSNDGKLIVSGSHDSTICIWSVHNGSLVSGPFKGHSSRVNSVVFSPDDMRLASGAEDCTVRKWVTRDISASQILTGHAAAVRSATFSPNGLQIASGSDDKTIRIWDALNGIPLHILRGHTQSVGCVRFSPCGDFAFSGSNDSTIRMWDTHHGTAIGNPFEGHSKRVTSIAISPEGERIVSGSLDHTVRVWHRGSSKLMAGPFEGHTDPVRSVEFSADGARIISASDDKTVRLWNAQGKMHLNTTDKPERSYGTNRIVLTTTSPDGTCVASAGFGWIRIWHIQNIQNATRKTMAPPVLINQILLLRFSFDGVRIFAAYDSGELFAWNVQTGEHVGGYRRFSPHSSIFHRCPIALSPDGSAIISAGESFDLFPRPDLDLWDLSTNRLICVIEINDQTDSFTTTAFSTNGARLATGTTCGRIDIWGRYSGRHIARFQDRGAIESMDISPDDTSVVYALVGGGVYVHTLTQEVPIMVSNTLFSSLDMSRSVKFSPDGAYIAVLGHPPSLPWSQGTSGWVRLYSAGDINGEPLQETQISCDSITQQVALEFTRNEPHRLLIACNSDSEIFVHEFRVDTPWTSYKSGEGGWLLNEHGQKVIWVPPEIRKEFPKANEIKLAETDSISVDYNHLITGNDWSKCYIGE